MCRPTLHKVLKKQTKGGGGRPPFDYVLMFKILVLERIYNLSDDQTEFQIKDRMSFMRFLGLHLGDRMPNARIIRLFQDMPAKANVMRELLDVYNRQLEDANLITRTGTIVDATPRQRNNKEERDGIKQRKVDATWTRKGNQTCLIKHTTCVDLNFSTGL